jgi:short subunit dehydrogenase-like uncharacterized protein
MPDPRWMIYGANGYTGMLVAEEALRRGHAPLLAGRSADKLAPLAEKLGLPWIAVDLANADALDEALGKVDLVLHAAGPFVHTSRPMIDACMRTGRTYTDVTGEIPVFEAGFARDEEARKRGIGIMSGVGFDVVPTDCLARYVADKLPSAVRLDLAICMVGKPSAGTAKSSIEMMPQGGMIRRAGKLEPLPLGRGRKLVRFTCGERTVLPIPWGDLSTAYRTTSIPDIVTYMAYPDRFARAMPFLAPLMKRVLAVDALRAHAQSVVERTVRGPDEKQRAAGRSFVWAAVESDAGRCVEAWLEAPEGYEFTAMAAVRAVERLLAERPVGALTPAGAFGADFVLQIPGTARFDRLPA